MSFVTPQFLIFLACIGGINYFVGSETRKWLLLLASLFFIGCFNLASLLAIVLLACFNFVAGQRLLSQQSAVLFRCCILFNCLAILANNYLLSVHGKVALVAGETDFRAENVLLLAGVSFYSLQHIAYLADIQLKRLTPEKNFIDFLWSSVYFPKFISGPVTSYQQLSAQLPLQQPSSGQVWRGFNRILLGFFKKMALADRLAPSVSSVFDYQDTLPGATIFMAAVGFTIQLYFDFSGYCDMAIGASDVLGIRLPENFDVPLRSTSITVFWRRWHQSLITFFTQYIFYPLSFRFRHLKKQSVAIAISVTFFISACWHGLGFTFMAWGACHMGYLLLEWYLQKQVSARQEKKSRVIKLGFALLVLVLVSFSHVFFRSTSTEQAMHLLSGIFDFHHFFPANWLAQFVAPLAVGGHQLEQFNLLVTAGLVALTLLFERKINVLAGSDRFRPALAFTVILLVFMFGVFGSAQRFIYMQF